MREAAFQQVRFYPKMLLIISFVLFLWFPLIGTIFHLKKSFTLNEKRELSKPPRLTLKLGSLRQFSKDFETYYNDNFIFRDILIFANSHVKMRYLSSSPVPKVLLGKEGWLYYHGDLVSSLTEGYLRKQPLKREQLEQVRTLLEAKRDWLAGGGMRYLFLVAPDKQSIYPEFLPGNYLHLESHIDQLKRYLEIHSDIQILDLRESLIKARNAHPVYYKTDTHWNGYGAFIASNEIVERLASYYTGLHPLSLADFNVIYESVANRDIAEMVAMGKSLKESVPQPIKNIPYKASDVKPTYEVPYSPNMTRNATIFKEQKSHALPRALVFRDSFGNALVPFLAENFRRIAFVDIWATAPYQRIIIERERPDVVVDEIVERLIPAFASFPMDPEFLNVFCQKSFNRSPALVARISAQTGYGGIRPLHQTDVSMAEIDHSPVLKLRASGNDPFVQLPPFSFPAGKRLVMEIEITSPNDTVMQVYYMTTSSREYSESRSIRRSIRRGRNVCYFLLTEPELYGNLRLDLGEMAGDYFLHSVEIRAI